MKEKAGARVLRTEPSTARTGRVLRGCLRQSRPLKLTESSVHLVVAGDSVAGEERLINKHLLQDKGTHWNKIRPNWGHGVR